MFDLSFYKVVYRVLDWSELPGCQYMNDNQRRCHQKRPSLSWRDKWMQAHCTESETSKELRSYIWETYLPYFSLKDQSDLYNKMLRLDNKSPVASN